MSVAFQSWEAASGPTVGYKVGTQSNHCCVEGSNYGIQPQQNTIIRGLSALSLYVPPHAERDPFVEDKSDHCEPARPSEESASLVPAPHLTSCNRLTEYSSAEAEEHNACIFSNSSRLMTDSVGKARLSDGNRRFGRSHGLPDSQWNSCYSQKLDVVCEDRPWDNRPMMEDVLEPDTISSSSSLSNTAGESACFSGYASQVEDDTEVQSSFKGHLDRSRSLEASLPVKKGLSRFYSGKSQSFSCLADVISVRDLAKPENPYNRKRKILQSGSWTLERPPLHPLRNGAVGISKKSFHNSKYTLALAVAMSTKEGSLGTLEQDSQAYPGVARSPSNAIPFRSFSLSDLQGAGSHFSPQ